MGTLPRRSTSILGIALSILIVVAPRPSRAQASPADFGFGTMLDQYGLRAEGERPLLAVLVEYADVRHTIDRSVYEKVLFGPGRPNLAQYYLENSRGRFTWRRGDVVGPVRLSNTYNTYHAVPEARVANVKKKFFAEVIQKASAAGFSFQHYDRNGDGSLTGDELALVFISASPADSGPGGQTWDTGSTGCNELRLSVPGSPGRSLGFCLGVAGVGGPRSFAAIAHETGHLLGAVDVYGAYKRLNPTMSVMGAIYYAEPSKTYHFDPWHKIKLGWMTPRILAIPRASESSCYLLESPGGGLGPRQPLILYDPRRGTDEYYIVEFRSRAGHDADIYVPDGGVAVWYVQTNPDKTLRVINSVIDRGEDGRLDSRAAAGSDDVSSSDRILPGRDGILQSVNSGSDGTATDELNLLVAPGHGRAPREWADRGYADRLWRDTDGDIRLQWFDGRDIGLRVRVGSVSPATPMYVEVELNPGLLRIDSVRPPSAVQGAEITLRGHFGALRGPKVVRIAYPGGGGASPVTIELEVLSWSCGELRVRVPRSAPNRSDGSLSVYDPLPFPGSEGYESNRFALRRR
jgi:M6 family metalloprotease-like protein